MIPAKRAKRIALIALLLGSALALLGTTQTWYLLTLAPGAASVSETGLSGQQASAGLSSFGLAALALTAALTIAGRVFRVVLGLLAVAFGAGVVSLSLGVMSSPRLAALDLLGELTGLSGEEASYSTVTAISASPWPAITATAGVLIALAGALVIATGHRWPRGGRKYDTAPTAPTAADGGAAEAAELDRISDWDQLSDGADPSEPGGGSHEAPPTR